MHPLSISFDDGATWMATGLDFHFAGTRPWFKSRMSPLCADLGPPRKYSIKWYEIIALVLGIFLGLVLFAMFLGGFRALRSKRVLQIG